MPTRVMTQATATAPSAAPLAMFWGRLKDPPPIIEPTTTPLSRTRPNLPVCGVAVLTLPPAVGKAVLPWIE